MKSIKRRTFLTRSFAIAAGLGFTSSSSGQKQIEENVTAKADLDLCCMSTHQGFVSPDKDSRTSITQKVY